MSNLSVNAIRFSDIDISTKANSGHRGWLWEAAPMAYNLFYKNNFVSIQLSKLDQPRSLILSAGHGSMLLCPSSPFWFEDVSMDEVKNSTNGVLPGHHWSYCRGWRDSCPRTRISYCYWFCPSRTFRLQRSITARFQYLWYPASDLEMEIWWKRSLKIREAASYAGLKNSTRVILYDSKWHQRMVVLHQKGVREPLQCLRLAPALVEDGELSDPCGYRSS